MKAPYNPAEGQNKRALHENALRNSWFQFYGDDLVALRQGPYKLVKNLTHSALSLFDLRVPLGPKGESGQAVVSLPVQGRMEQALDRYMADAGRTTQGLSSATVVDQEKVLESLRALGYVQ